MTAFFHRCLFLNLLAAFTWTVVAQPFQSSRFTFDRLGVEHGLPNEYVNCIAQDKFGFMWFGTKNGLCRYDGQKFKTYQSIPGDSTSLPGNEILLLFSDSRGNLWVGANGLCRFNFDRENFTRLAPPRYDAMFDKLKFVSPICEDNAGNLWLGTFGQGLFKLNPVSNELTPIELDSLGRRSIIYALSTNGSDTMWIASNNHQVTALNTRTMRQKRFTLAQKGDIQKVFADRAGRLWLGAMEEPLQQIHVQASGEIVFTRVENIKFAHFFNCFGDDRNGNLWIGSQLEGVYIFNAPRNEFQSCRYSSRDLHSLPGDDIQTIFEDRSGNMWIATNKGVGKWARWKKPFRHFQYDTEDSNSLNNGEVTGIDQDENGNLWIATLNAGFCKFDPRAGNFTRYDPSTCAIKSPWALEILASRNGFVWIATNFQHGLNRFELATGKCKEYLLSRQDSTSLSFNIVTTLFEDHAGRVWIGAAFRGLNLYVPEIDGFRRFQHDPSDSASLSHNNVLAIYEDQEPTLWVGTSNGLNRYDSRSNSFTRYIPAADAPEDMTSFEVYSIIEDARGHFWLGTNSGLYLFDQQNKAFERVVQLSGLADGRIFGILEDGTGNLWLQSLAALVKFDPQTRTLRVFDREDGWIQTGVYEQEWRNACKKLTTGELAFGGSNGITIFHPDNIEDNPHMPPVHITGFNLSYQPVEFGQNPAGLRKQGDSLLTRSLLLTDHLTLRHTENTFSFDFAALDYTQPAANQYAFMLEGFHDDWVFSGNQRTATFTNIPPGDYTFRVKGSNNDDLWNAEGDAIKITILPPWWRTTAAYLGYAVLLLAIIYGLRRFEMSRIRMRNELEMKNFEAQKLQEVDHLKSRFFANISHEFRTPLTLILGPLEDVLAKVTDQAAKADLRVMERNAKRLLRLINQLLDLSRLESGRMTLHAGRGDFIGFLKGIVMSFASLAEQKKIALRFECEPELAERLTTEMFFDHDKIEKIFYNLLSNAFKFSLEGGAVIVECGMGIADSRTNPSATIRNPQSAIPDSCREYVEIQVKDTGIGIPPDRLPYIFDRFYQVDEARTSTSSVREHEGSGLGLALTKELVERHYGEIAARSEAGKGSEFIVRLPLGNVHLQPEEIVEESGKFAVSSDLARGKLQVASEHDNVIQAIQQSITPSIQPPPSDRNEAEIPAHRDDQPLILVVDDHPDVRNYIRRHLEPDFQVMEAKDGHEGIESARDAVPDLVVSDVMMPKRDGYQLCEALKTNEKTSHIPVILLTARAGEENKLAGLETGADDYLVKPFSSKELQARAKNLIALRRKLAEHFRREGLLQPHEIKVPSVEEAFLQKLMQVTEQHLGEEEFDLEVLRNELNMGQKQLYRKIKALTGQTPTEFIRTIRLRRAKQLLAQHAGTISEIAFRVGFNNLSYFSKCFREEFEVLPSEVPKK